MNIVKRLVIILPSNRAASTCDFISKVLTCGEIFNDYLVYQQRENGLTRITVRDLHTQQQQQLHFNDEAFTLYLYGNKEIDSDKLRLYYSSMTTPGTHYDFNLNDGRSEERRVGKECRL